MITTDNEPRASVERTSAGATVRFERRYTQSREVVWLALTRPEQLAQWLDDSSIDLAVGGSFVVRFNDGVMNGRITDLDPNRVLAYSWHEGQFGESHVRWELEDAPGGGTTLRLTHSKLRDESATGFAAGWHTHLDRLGAHLDGETETQSWDAARFEELLQVYERRSETA